MQVPGHHIIAVLAENLRNLKCDFFIFHER